MPNSLNFILRYLHRMADSAGPGEVSDAELLDRFVGRRDEAAFELLVWRHGPMVLGLCQRLLRHEQDAEDAFQATFYALARKAGAIGKKGALASWLYKVAYRVACRARSRSVVFSKQSVVMADRAAPEPKDDVVWGELRNVLDREVAGLPERYRRPLLLCYFEGKTHEEAARLLGCPKGTLAARLARARERLRRRLTRRGWALSAGALASLMAEQALAAAVPASLARVTVMCALAYGAGKTAATGILSANAVALTEGVLRMMWYSKLKILAGVLLTVLLAGTGIGLVVRHTWAAAGPDNPKVVQAEPPAPPKARPELQDKSKAESLKLRAEIAELRDKLSAALKKIRDLKDAPVTGETVFEIIRLRHAKARNVAQVLQQVFQPSALAGFGPGQTNRLSIVPDPDTNSLLVRANPVDMQKIRTLLRDSLDLGDADSDALTRTWVLGPLKYARAADVANVLRDVFPESVASGKPQDRNTKPKSNSRGVTLSLGVDERSNSLVLACSVPRYQEIRKLVEQLELSTKDAPAPQARLIALKNASAADVAKVLREVYGNADKSAGFSADSRSNRLVIRCAPALQGDVMSLVRELDMKAAEK